MLQTKKNAHRSISLLAAVGLAGAMLAANPLAANAAATVVDFSSTDAANYGYLSHIGGDGGTNWAPWPDAAGLNAPQVTGSSNWNGSSVWHHGWAVQDDGSGTNNALWVQKAQAGAATSGIQIAALADGQSLISATDKTITLKVKAFDDSVPVSATLSDVYGGQPLTVLATVTTKDVYNTLTLNFASPNSGSYVANYSYAKLSITFDPDNIIAGNSHDDWGQGIYSATNSKAYIVDDLTYTVSAGDLAPSPAVPHKLTFEDNDTLGAGAYGESVPPAHPAGYFGGGGTGQGTPPVAHTGKALEFNKSSTGANYSGFVAYSAPDGEVLTSANYKIISFDYYSPDASATPLFMKVESAGPTLEKKLSANPGWNTFSVDVSTLAGWSADVSFLRLVLIPDFDPSTDVNMVPFTDQKYYIDNIVINGWGKAVKTGSPVLTRTTAGGSTFTVSRGAWTGNRISYSYKWYRCVVSSTSVRSSSPVRADRCVVISGQTGDSYTATASDKGKFIRATVTATTDAGAAAATSKSTKRIG